MSRDDITKSLKEDFINTINKQKGRTSLTALSDSKYLSKDQENSWNNEGFILIPKFLSKIKCDEMEKRIKKIDQKLKTLIRYKK